MRKHLLAGTLLAAVAAASVLFGGSAAATGPASPVPAAGSASAGSDLFVLTTGGTLERRNGAIPVLVKAKVKVTGLAKGDRLIGLDRRPANGMLYALGAAGQLYTVDAGTGKAMAVGTPIAFERPGYRLRLQPDRGPDPGRHLVRPEPAAQPGQRRGRRDRRCSGLRPHRPQRW